MHLLRLLLTGLQTAAMAAAACVDVGARSVADDLQSLAPNSSVAVEVRQRWSEVDAPVATVVFNATSEQDISEVVCPWSPSCLANLTVSARLHPTNTVSLQCFTTTGQVLRQEEHPLRRPERRQRLGDGAVQPREHGRSHQPGGPEPGRRQRRQEDGDHRRRRPHQRRHRGRRRLGGPGPDGQLQLRRRPGGGAGRRVRQPARRARLRRRQHPRAARRHRGGGGPDRLGHLEPGPVLGPPRGRAQLWHRHLGQGERLPRGRPHRAHRQPHL